MPAQIASAHVAGAATTAAIASPGTGFRLIVHGMHLSVPNGQNAQIAYHAGATIFSTEGSNDSPMAQGGLILAEAPAATGIDVVGSGAVSYTIFYSTRPV